MAINILLVVRPSIANSVFITHRSDALSAPAALERDPSSHVVIRDPMSAEVLVTILR